MNLTSIYLFLTDQNIEQMSFAHIYICVYVLPSFISIKNKIWTNEINLFDCKNYNRYKTFIKVEKGA